MMSEMTAALLAIVFVLVYLACMGLGVAQYVVSSLSLYKIAKKRCISNPWLAWIPVGSSWIVGSITDDFDSENGIKRKWRVVLMSLNLALIAAMILLFVVFFAYIVIMALSNRFVEEELLLAFFVFYAALVVLIAVASVAVVLEAVCIYKVFENICPQKALKYIVLSILVPLGYPICLWKCNEFCAEKVIPVVTPSMPIVNEPLQSEVSGTEEHCED